MRGVIAAARRRVTVVAEPGLEIDVATFTTKTGDGTTAIDTAAKTLTIAFGTTATSLRGQTFVTPGQRYRVAWTMASTNATQGQAGFGTSLGGPQYRPTLSGVAGVNTFDFTATFDTLYPTFQRASTGETTFSAFSLTKIPEVTWSNLSPQPITPGSWSALSVGVTVDSGTGAISIPATGTLLSAAGPFTTVAGKPYRLVWTVAGNAVAVPIGTTQAGTTFKSNSVTHAPGNHSYEFTPTGTTTWIQFQRQTAGTAVISNIALQEVGQAVVVRPSFDSAATKFDSSTIKFDSSR